MIGRYIVTSGHCMLMKFHRYLKQNLLIYQQVGKIKIGHLCVGSKLNKHLSSICCNVHQGLIVIPGLSVQQSLESRECCAPSALVPRLYRRSLFVL